jgi:hypothetical protein
MNTLMRTVGGALGAQIASSIVAAHIGTGGLPAESGFTIAFWVSAVTLVFAFLAGLLIPGRRSARPLVARAEPHAGERREAAVTSARP